MSDNERDIGRIEGKLDSLIDMFRDHRDETRGLTKRVSEIETTLASGKRVTVVVSAALAAVGTAVAGFFSHK